MTNLLAEPATPDNNASAGKPRTGKALRPLLSVALTALALGLLALLNQLEWARTFPQAWAVDAGSYVTRFLGAVTALSVGPWTLVDLTRAIASLLSWPERLLTGVLTQGFRFSLFGGGPLWIPAIPWFSVALVCLLTSLRFGGKRLALLVGACLAYFLFTGLWDSALQTLVTVMVAIPIGCGLGLLLGRLVTGLLLDRIHAPYVAVAFFAAGCCGLLLLRDSHDYSVLLLASEAGSFITGAEIVVDGGQHINGIHAE